MMKKFSPRSFLPLLWEDELWDEENEGGLSVWEDKEKVYVEAAVPGMKMDDIEVTYEKGILWVKAEKKQEEKNSDKKYYRRASQSFSYRLTLPGQINESKTPEATYQEGVLKISFVKFPQTRPKKINIKKS